MKTFTVSKVLIVCCLVATAVAASAQNILQRPVTLQVSRQRMDWVLEIISNRGGFYFSYQSNIVTADSLLTFSVENQPLGALLQRLFGSGFEFRESGAYVIIRRAPVRLTFVTSQAVATDNYYTIAGYVLDDADGRFIHRASVYEPRQLRSALTNTGGFFTLKLKQKKPATLAVSKEAYRDTSFRIDPGVDQRITVTLQPLSSSSLTLIGPDDYFAPEELKLRVRRSDSTVTEYTYRRTDSAAVETASLGRWLIPDDQKAQSRNLFRFFTTRPYQLSLTPGLGTHGKLSGQVSNVVSVNLIGGYNGGVRGVEVGGAFNVVKRNVHAVQAAGFLNVVGGNVSGVQAAGFHNAVSASVRGVQAAGFSNRVKGTANGVQAAGFANSTSGAVRGLQIAGGANRAKDTLNGWQVAGAINTSKQVRGVQMAGAVNIARGEVKGFQISGVLNVARKLKGVQIGLINIADTSEGLSIGLLTIVKKGYRRLAFSTDEVANVNLAYKTGHRPLYNIILVGANLGPNKVYTFGYGIGTEKALGKRLFVQPELTAQQLYLGTWDASNLLVRLRTNLHLPVAKGLALFAGPVVNVYVSNQTTKYNGYKLALPPRGYPLHSFGGDAKAWIGWTAGLTLF